MISEYGNGNDVEGRVVAYFEVPSRHLPEITEEMNGNLIQSSWPWA
jgi:hypothetical protein